MHGPRTCLRRLVRLETAAGPEWTDGTATVTPIVATAAIGKGLGGWRIAPDVRERRLFECARPFAVEVSCAGQAYRARIFDPTGLGRLLILLLALLVLNEVWIRTRKRRERS